MTSNAHYQALKAKIENELRPQLPPGMQLHIVSNDAVFILEIVNSLKEHLLEGNLLAALVVWLFLQSLRATIIVSLPDRTIRSRVFMVQVQPHGYVQVAFTSGEMITLSPRTMVGSIERPPRPRRLPPRASNAS